MSVPAQQRSRRGLAAVADDAVHHQLVDRAEVADDDAGKAPLLAQHAVQQRRIGDAGHAGIGVEGRHEAGHAARGRGPERRQIGSRAWRARRARPPSSRGRLRPHCWHPDAWRRLPPNRRRPGGRPASRRSGRRRSWRRSQADSPLPSAIRPQRGSRATSSIGANTQLMPAAAASRAEMRSASRIAARSKLAACPSGIGKMVR